MLSEREPGRILTFYSYKGGTGRSMVLANVAWILASAGRRVLMVDWDLEAPGLHRYFRPFLIDDRLSATPGLIDFVIRYATEAKRRGTRTQSDGTVPASPPESPEVVPEWVRKEANILDYRIAIDWEFPAGGALDLIAAGKQDLTYAARVSTFHWQNFYEHLGGGHLVNAMRDVVRSEYDYVLIDSRTGVSDTAGICTVQLPDELVVCFTYNNQSTEGAAGVARSVYQQRYIEGGDTTFRVHPVPMRVDTNEERRLQKRQQYARKLFDPLLHHASGDRGAYWTAIEVPSIAAFAYEEVLATFSDDPSDPKRLLGALIRVTGLLTGGKVSSFRLLAEPEERDEVLTRFAELEGDEPQERTTVVEDPADAAARRAERAYVALSPDEKRAATLLWMRMVRVTSEEEAADLARVRVSMSELEPEQIPPQVIEAFLNAGVVNRTKSTLGSDEKLESVDDAFLSRWPRIREWIEEHREFLLWRQQLRLRVAEWEERGRPRVRPNFDDAKAEKWKKAGYDFSSRETAFIEAGDRFSAIIGCVMFIVLAILLAWGGWKLIGVVRGYFDRREQTAFDRQKAVTAARVSKDPAAPPAAEPVGKSSPIPPARKWVLRRTLPISSAAVAISPDGAELAVATASFWDKGAGGNRIRVFNLATGEEIRSFAARGTFVEDLKYSGHGRLLGSSGDAVTIWDARSEREVRSLAGKWDSNCLAFSPDGTVLAVGGSEGAKLFEVATGTEIWSSTGLRSPDISAVASRRTVSPSHTSDAVCGTSIQRVRAGRAGCSPSCNFIPTYACLQRRRAVDRLGRQLR